MIVALVLALQTVAPAADAVPDEVVVIGERLKGWKGKVTDTIGIRSCKTTRSTGDKEVDRIGCRVLIDCFVPMKPRLTAAAKAAGRDKAVREAAFAPINAEMTACFKERRATLIAELADRRAGRAGS